MRAFLLGLVVIAMVACSDGSDAGPSSSSTSAAEEAGSASSTAVPSTAGDSLPPAIEASVPTPRPGDGQSTGPLGSRPTAIDTGDGSIQIGGGTVPASAASLPLPDDFEVQLVSETPEATGFSGVSAQSVADLAEFYRAALPEAGLEIAEDAAPSPGIVVITFAGPDAEGDVALSGAPGGQGTTVIVTFTPTR